MTTLPTYEEIYNGPGSRFENETAVEHYLGVSLEDAMRRIGDGTTQYIEVKIPRFGGHPRRRENA